MAVCKCVGIIGGGPYRNQFITFFKRLMTLTLGRAYTMHLLLQLGSFAKLGFVVIVPGEAGTPLSMITIMFSTP